MLNLAVDIGGTFTDLIFLDAKSGQTRILKVPTTPTAPEKGVIGALKRYAASGGDLSRIRTVIHATTLAANALVGQTGLELPRVAFLTTHGFTDILEIGRQNRPELYNPFFKRIRPLVDKENRFGVKERMKYDGSIAENLHEEGVLRTAALLAERRYDAAAVCLLHSYANPAHEFRVKSLLRDGGYKGQVTVSSEVLREIREYERATTTVANTILSPIVSRYLDNLVKGLVSLGVTAGIHVMQSDGGVIPAEKGRLLPCKLIESGPAAGVIAAGYYAGLAGVKNAVSFDMGGTTAKASLIEDGRTATTTDYEVGGLVHSGRFVKGSGYPIRFPFMDLSEIGAGGGSIIWVDEGGLIRVGPRSAGAEPGPACYGLGGKDATVTDANLILGRLHEGFFLGGEMRVHPRLAEEALQAIAARVDMSLVEAASMAVRVVNANMVKAVRLVSTERGVDLRGFTLVAFGGAGPTHACDIMCETGIKRAIVPPNPGLVSAVGLLVSEYSAQASETHLMPLDESMDFQSVEAWFTSLKEEVLGFLEAVTPQREDVLCIGSLDLRYHGQSYELNIEIPGELTAESLPRVREKFHQKHELTNGYRRDDLPVEVVNLRVKGIVPVRPKPPPRLRRGRGDAEQAKIGTREVYFDRLGRATAYLRGKLLAGDTIEGPAVIHQYDSTTLVRPGQLARVDDIGLLMLEMEG
ncbi:MAG: hydantoinase/oxoprolinase family protein [Candidatus Bathyarchaeia archaeon]